jgi:hypothetical protein
MSVLFEGGQKIPQAQLFKLPILLMVAQGNLMASSIIFIGKKNSFFIQDVPYCSLVLAY